MNQRITRKRRKKMIIGETDEQKFQAVLPIFIHIPKTAGNSIYRSLGMDNSLNHHTAYKKSIEDSERWERGFTFCFIRNPWDQILSWYLFHPQASRLDFNEWILGGLKPHWARNWVHKIQKNDPFDQWQYITDDQGEIIVDFIGRFENIEEDYLKLCSKLHLAPNKLKHINKTTHNHYRNYYSDEARDYVAERYKHFIEHFNYEF